MIRRVFGPCPPPARAVALFMGTVLVGLWGCSPVQRAPRSQPPRAAEPARQTEEFAGGVIHVVRPGQTLWRIARAYGVPQRQVAEANGIDDPTSIEIGTRLLIPGATETLEIAPHPAPPTPVEPRDVAGGPLFIWPVPDGHLLSGFGAPRRAHRHRGIDIDGRRGERVLAAADGRVVYSGSTMRGYGKTVIVDHGAGFESLYAHNSKLLVGVGDRVQRGEAIALVGDSGNASTEHCHFEIRKDRVPVDPMPLVSRGRR